MGVFREPCRYASQASGKRAKKCRGKGYNWGLKFPSVLLIDVTPHWHWYSSHTQCFILHHMNAHIHIYKGKCFSICPLPNNCLCHLFPGPPSKVSSVLSKGRRGKRGETSKAVRSAQGRGGGGGQETGGEKHNPGWASLLISNGNIWKCTLPLAKHTLDRGRATSEKRQNSNKL